MFHNKGVAVPALLISQVEVCFGLLVVSVPTYRPLYRKLVYGTAEKESQPGISGPRPLAYLGFKKISSYASKWNDSEHRVEITAGKDARDSPRGICIQDDVELVRHIQRDGIWVRVSDDTQCSGNESKV